MQTSLLGIANKALALLRKRVFTKSPVRENRTPGSARGLSGNWQSYRNQLPFDAHAVHFVKDMFVGGRYQVDRALCHVCHAIQVP